MFKLHLIRGVIIMARKSQKSGSFQEAPEMFNEFVNMGVFDKEKVMKSHRKNIEALTEANKTAVEVLKSLTQLQSQYMKKSFEDMTSLMQGMMNPGAPRNPLEAQTTAIKNQIDRTLEHNRAITTTLADSHQEIYKIFNNRISSGIQDVKESSDALKKKMRQV